MNMMNNIEADREPRDGFDFTYFFILTFKMAFVWVWQL